ncbi:MAG: HAD family hydrolase [Clostridia bacterium]|nr:HAD family hydrolase [Clostridia bacterium]
MKFENILFDLDGTLTDPGLGITNSILYAFEKFGLPLPPREELYSYIGPPLIDSFQKNCGVTLQDAKKLLDLYREYFAPKGLFENTVYPGVAETLKQLNENGLRLYLATSKPEPFAKQILEHFDLMQYFTFVGGSTMDETRTDKAEVIAYVLDANQLDPAKTLMVGDRKYDVEGGHSCRLSVAAVLYGYGDEAELAGADYLLSTPQELLNL